MAPIGWQVLAGLTVRASRSATSAVVCRKSMVGFFFGLDVPCSRLLIHSPRTCCTNSLHERGVERGPFLLFPRRRDERPDARVDQTVDLAVEIDRPLEAGIRTAVVVAVQLLAGDAHLLHDELFLDSGAEDVRPVDFQQPLGFVVADVVDHEPAFVHVRHHALVIVERHAGGLPMRLRSSSLRRGR